MIKLYNLFLSVDATQVEINPLGMTTDDRIVCFDAKITFDDNAMFRQAKLFNDLKIGSIEIHGSIIHTYIPCIYVVRQ